MIQKDPATGIPQIEGLSPYTRQTYLAATRKIHQAYHELVSELEALPAGNPHRNAAERLPYYESILHEMPQAARTRGLCPEEQAVATVAGYASGLGFMKQEVQVGRGLCPADDGHQANPFGREGMVRVTGIISRQALEAIFARQHPAFSEELRMAALDAVLFKGSLTSHIPLAPGSLALKILICIRDQETRALEYSTAQAYERRFIPGSANLPPRPD